MKLNTCLKLYDEITAAFVEVFKKLREEIINGEVDITDVHIESRGVVSFIYNDKIATEIERLMKEKPIIIKCLTSYVKSLRIKERIEKFKDYAHKLCTYMQIMKYNQCYLETVYNTKDYSDILRIVQELDTVCDKNAINDFMNKMEENDEFKKQSTFIFGTMYTTYCRSPEDINAHIESDFKYALQCMLNREDETDERAAETKICEDFIYPLFQSDTVSYIDPQFLDAIAKEAKVIIKPGVNINDMCPGYRITITDIS